MLTDCHNLNAEEQRIAKLIAARLAVAVADVAAAIVDTERWTKLVGVTGLTLQACEAYHVEMKTAQEELKRILKENLLQCPAEPKSELRKAPSTMGSVSGDLAQVGFGREQGQGRGTVAYLVCVGHGQQAVQRLTSGAYTCWWIFSGSQANLISSAVQ